MRFNLDRYINAQIRDFDLAFKELSNGKKESHYMWYIFPQMKGLGSSFYSEYYGIGSIDEAIEYYQNDFLRNNMNKLLNILLGLKESDPYIIFGTPDDLKLKSSMTLFYLATKEIIFKRVIDKFYNGELDLQTIKLLNIDLKS